MVDHLQKSSATEWLYSLGTWWHKVAGKRAMPLILGVIATSGVLTLRSLGVFQVWELHAFDWMMNHRLAEQPDERIVIIGITEEDIERSQSAVISDTFLAEVILAVKDQHPAVIGLDLFRNVAHDDGYSQLQEILAETPNIIGIEKVIDDDALAAVSGNAVLTQDNRVAASDLIVDVDGRIRRGFLFPSAVGDLVIEGLAFRVALEYLATHNIYPNPDANVLELGHARLPPFEKNSGGYSNADAGGYQIVMNWRSNLHFQTFSAYEAVEGKIPPNALQDKVVLIGSMQAGDADVFFTPYSMGTRRDSPTLLPSYGVEIHASLASQIISAAFGQRPPLKTLSDYGEAALITLFAWLGIGLYHTGRSDFRRLQLYSFFLFGNMGLSLVLLMIGGWWLPIVPTGVALITAPIITRLHKLNRLQALSEIDELTQLANRRGFRKHLTKEWQRAVRSRTPISLILCDVDYFKLYNDTYGHPQGDECLRQVACAIGQSVRRPDDLAARYGGEEFVVLLPNTDAEGAQRLAKEAAANVRALAMEHSASEISAYVSISLGVTTVFPREGVAVSTLVDTADLGLYEAKRRGRNQMVLRLPWAV